MLKRFVSYYKPYRKLFIADMIASLFMSLSGMVYPVISRSMLNDFIPNRKYELIIRFGIALLVIYIIRALLNYFISYYGHVMGVKMQSDMRKELFSKIERLPYSFFDNHETGSIMSRLTNDLFEVSELAHHGPENIFMSILSIVIAFVYLSGISLPLTLIIFSCVPIMMVIAIKLRGYMRNASRRSKAAISKINANISSSISGVRVTKAFNNDEIELNKFLDSDDEFVKARTMHFKGFSLFNVSTSFIIDIFNVVTLISGGIFLYNGKISFGDYSAFIVSISLFTSPVMKLVQFTEQFEEGASGFERFIEIIDTPIEADREDAKEYRLEGNIEFENVSFAYEGHEDKEVLDGVSFKVNKGETIALVGPSGGGKTTICHLLPRFYNYESGSIRIDGHDINDVRMHSLRENIGIVQQDVFLFSGTFYENILYGKPDATYEEVIAASKKANIFDYIESLPNGFDTQIGERGVKLSGGQKQRLSIARVFLKNPSILILDEATSALDNTTELLIQEALDSLRQGRTTIVVAHRLSTIKNADKILVIANGRIKEEGNHEELLKKEDGIYHSLYEAQFKESISEIDSKLMMQ